MTTITGSKKLRKILLSSSIFILIILVWEMVVQLGDVSRVVIVPPSEIAPVVISESDILLEELLFTFEEVVFGWLAGCLIGFLFAVLIHPFQRLVRFVVGLSVGVNAVPLIALAAILGGIIGTDQFGKTVIVAILCFFPLFISSLKGFSLETEGELNLLRTYGASNFENFIKLKLPSAMPWILNTVKINVVIAIFAAVVGEFFGAHGGIGDLILAEKGLYDLSMVWAAIFYIIVAGSTFYFTVELINKWMVPWRKMN